MNILCIAGFLGSGKTTLLLHIARRMTESGLRLAVVENEIGEIGVDGASIRERDVPVRELFGGCICCTLQSGLVQTLLAVKSDYSPDWVLLEPTGLAVPQDIVKLVREHLEEAEVLRAVTLVDAARWPMLIEVIEPLVTAQLAAAHVVAVNKVDAVTEAELRAVEEDVARLAPDARLVRTAAAEGRGVEEVLRALL